MDSNLSGGEYTIRWKRIKKTNNSKSMVICHFGKVSLWTIFDAGSAFGFHAQDLYHDKIIHAWFDPSDLENKKDFDRWKKQEIYDDPLFFQLYLMGASVLNVSVAATTLQAAAIALWDYILLYYQMSDDDWGMCILSASPCYSPDDDAYDESLHGDFYLPNANETWNDYDLSLKQNSI